MERDLLELKNISKVIGSLKILKNISFRFEEGKRYLLTGANGSGKTTLLKIISSLMRATTGKVYYRGHEIGALDGEYLKNISFLSHQLNMYEEMTGFQNLEFFARLYEVKKPRERAMELIELAGLMFFANERVKNYSQGMKQRLAVAKAIIHRPKVLLFDEPFVGLDLRGVELLQEVIEEVLPQEEGLFILATHDPEIGSKLTDRYLYLERGELASQGDRVEFLKEGIEGQLKSKRDVGVW